MPVAISVVPAESDTTIELAANDVEFVPPEETASVPDSDDNDRHVVPIA